MVRLFRKARAHSDKFPQALQWSKEVAEYLNANYQGFSIQVFLESFGDMNTIYWFSDFENLAEIETFNARLMADQQYWERLSQIGDLFVDTSGEDTLLFGT